MIEATQRTDGAFLDEAQALAAFDRIVEANGAFRLYREVPGEYLQPRPDTEDKGARIDRLLVPLKPAVDAGWRAGAIAVEGKCSGKKLGPIVSQALDYSRCAWTLEEGVPGLRLLCLWTFLFPVKDLNCDLGLIAANNRIGQCSIRNESLSFSCCATGILTVETSGGLRVRNPAMGKKRGSR